MNKSQVIIVHIGPVQEFIFAARRTRDLWYGSWLLSELSKAAALKIVEMNDNDLDCLVFPAPESISDLQSVTFRSPNKVIARIPHMVEIGNEVKKAVIDRLAKICDAVFEIDKIRGDFERDVARQQVLDLPEIYWVTCPIANNYTFARKYAEALMAARKSTRYFKPVTWGSPQPKSSLDGLRESVIPESAYEISNEEELRLNYGVRKGERLCGVGLLKRHGRRGKDDRFPSTSHLAALPLLGRLKDKQATEQLFSSLRKLGIPEDVLETTPMKHAVFGYNDGHLLYEERLQEFFTETNKLEQAKKKLQDFLKTAFNDERPLPYYALIKADGDNMGKTIDQLQVASHRQFSKCLSRFAAKVECIVNEESGALIFSGADDVIALVPVHTALACARRLSKTFYQEMAQFKTTDNGGEITPTLSAGLVVAHHLEPLSIILDLAAQAEREAKAVEGKNALAITVNKRSGVARTIKGKWGDLDHRLTGFIELFCNEALSSRGIYDLQDLALRLGLQDYSVEISGALNNLARREAIRILKRKKAEKGRSAVDENVMQQLKGYILDEKFSIEQLAEELIVARTFAEVTIQSREPTGTVKEA